MKFFLPMINFHPGCEISNVLYSLKTLYSHDIGMGGMMAIRMMATSPLPPIDRTSPLPHTEHTQLTLWVFSPCDGEGLVGVKRV